MSAPQALRVPVRELCEFTAKRGDLDLRFTPAPSAQEGIYGHATVTARRGAGYVRELALEGSYQGLTVRGRADGLATEPLLLEEIKTYRGALERMPDNHRALHWAQLKLYGALYCRQHALPELRLALVYYHVDTGRETAFAETFNAHSLSSFFEAQCQCYLAWAEQVAAHRQRRDAALAAVAFPHAEFHAGQRQLSEAVYRHIQRGQVLLAQAPTGIGKSIGTLFPALKAMAGQHIEKIFYLTAKTSGRQLALHALASLHSGDAPLPLRVLELVAREKCCEHPDKACHGQSCPLACGFYDRLPAARAAAVAEPQLHQAHVRAVAARHQVCPYYLSQDLVRWADVVVADYNYYFDRSALLHSLTALNDWKVAVLIDEAHNLVERGRAMYSAALDQRQWQALKKLAPAPVKKKLGRLNTLLSRLASEQAGSYQRLPAPPPPVLEALHAVVVALATWFSEHPENPAAELLSAYLDALGFLALAEAFGTHSIFDVQKLPAGSGRTAPAVLLSLRNVLPGPFLAPRFATATSAAAFSATLNPPHYFQQLLGLATSTTWLDVPSPFSASQLEVRVAAGISTRYAQRADSLRPIAQLIANQYRQLPGNYLAFFSSYDYLQQVLAELRSAYPGVPAFAQSRQMTEAERTAFLARFGEHTQGLGFAVLGGAFAEGIDLPGKRLIGAFVATLGLPQINPVNEQIKLCMQQLFGNGKGYDYAYLYPGMQKVVQAAGRVIRSTQDRGLLVLIDTRFAEPGVQKLLPAWWQPQRLETAGQPTMPVRIEPAGAGYTGPQDARPTSPDAHHCQAFAPGA